MTSVFIIFGNNMRLFYKSAIIVILSLCCIGSAAGHDIKNIKIVTPEWEDCTHKDGTGLFFEIVRNVYEPEGIRVEYEFVPWKRAVYIVEETKKADAYLSRMKDSDHLAPYYPLWVEYAAAVFRKDNITEWKGIATLSGKSAVWMRGYDYHTEKRIADVKLKRWDEIDEPKQAWELIEKGRYDFYIDTLLDIEQYVRKNKVDMVETYRIETIWGEPSYMIFAKTLKSEKLIEIYNRRIIELFKSGELKKIFNKWNIRFDPEAWQK